MTRSFARMLVHLVPSAAATAAPGTRLARFLPLAALVAGLLVGCGGTATVDGEAADNATQSSAVTADARIHPEAWPALEPPLALDPEIEASIDTLIAGMSTAEKVGQITQAEIRHATPEDVREYHLGSVLNGGGSHPGGDRRAAPADWLALADAYWNAAADGSDGAATIPILWGVDAVHGHNNVIGATIFPHNVGLGATRDADLVREIARATAVEVTATGLDWNFSPTVAVARDLRWGRSYESYSQDPELVARLGAAYVEGVQGPLGATGDEGFLGDGRVLATAKHYLGDGGTTGGVDQGDTVVSEAELRDVHGAGYVTALEAGAQTVMASFSSWHGRKLHGHRELITSVLKGRMGFDGFVVGDWNGHGQVATCTNESCAPAFLAGVDMFMVPEDWKALIEATLAQVESGEIPMERLDDAVRRILRVKHRFGLFDPQRRGVAPSQRPFAGEVSLLGAPAHREIARRAVRQSLVLLKNAGADGSPVLPVAAGSRVLIAGEGADDIGQQSGGWTVSWQGTGNSNDDFPGGTTIGRGLEEAIVAAGGSAILAPDGAYDGAAPDVAIVVFGEQPYAEFQGDRLALGYGPQPDRGLELLRSLRAEGVATVAVFLTGRPLWVNPHLNASDAFVVAWLPGSEGAGVADVLVAGTDGPAHDFAGRLPFAWPRTTLDARPAELENPLFAYGFGLSYGDDGALPQLSEEVAEGTGPAPTHTYFSGGAVDGWRLDTQGAVTVSPVDRQVQEDARELAWTAMGGVGLRSDQTIDLRREANGGLSLAFDVLVVEPPAGGVQLTMAGTTGAGSVPLGDMLRGLDGQDWYRVRVSLSCLDAAGADLSRLQVAWALQADAPMTLRVGEISLDTAGDGEALCPGETGTSGADDSAEGDA
ncbi:MAG: glycoside hydrolase family 3 N-terminal domain-containing protein [Acidobacteriota bacterium]